MFLPNGSLAPSFSLSAVASNRPINPATVKGPLLLIFHSYQTVDKVSQIIRAIRESYPNPNQVLIATIADLRIVPRILRGLANRIMLDAYHEASRQIPESQKPRDHIIILPDWSGKVFEAYNVPNTSEHVALVLINQRQTIHGTYAGDKSAEAALQLLAGVTT